MPVSRFALFGVILLAGLIGGRLAAAVGFIPRITGYIAIGMLLGPGVLNLLDAKLLDDARVFVDIALGLLLFELGRRLDFNWLRHDPWLLLMGIAESALSFALILLALIYFQVPPLPAAMAAAIGTASSPAVVLLVAQELGAEGQVTRRAFSLVAINNIAALLFFVLVLPFVHVSFHSGFWGALLQPFYFMTGSLLLGGVLYLLTLPLARLIGKEDAQQFILLTGMIVLAVGAAEMLNLSVLMTLLTFGIAVRNFDRRHAVVDVDFGYAGQLFFVVLFVILGAQLQWHHWITAGWAALVFLLARFIGSATAIFAFARPSRLSVRQTTGLTLALVPMTDVALRMTQIVADIYPDFGTELGAILIATVTILQLLGPVAARFAFVYAGEANPEKIATGRPWWKS